VAVNSRIFMFVAAALLTASPAWGQRVQFGSTLPETSVYQGGAAVTPTTPVPGPGPVTPIPSLNGGVPSYVAPGPPAGTWDPYAGTSAPPGGTTPYYTEPAPVYPQSPPVFSQQPGALFPEGVPWRQQPGTYAYPAPDGSVTEFQRLLQQIRFEYTWLAPIGDDDKFGVNTAELNGTFGFPIFYNTETPLLVTPGFAVHALEGPVGDMAGEPNLPPLLYDAYLDLAWKPKVTPWLSGDLGVRGGVYSDFEEFNSDSFRLMGRGLGVLTFTPTAQVALGVVYLDRNRVKLLPAGGLIWTPNPDARYEIIFPYPKLSFRLTTIGTTEWWWFVAGEYGGGAWTVERLGTNDHIDYNDLRAIVGLEWTGQSGLRGSFEVGYVFEREILFTEAPPPEFEPNDTVMVRGSIVY
jgi:hypothetical protein